MELSKLIEYRKEYAKISKTATIRELRFFVITFADDNKLTESGLLGHQIWSLLRDDLTTELLELIAMESE